MIATAAMGLTMALVSTTTARAESRRPVSDLAGLYLGLGPMAAISRDHRGAGRGDAVFGAEMTLARVHEHRALGAFGLTVMAARYVYRDGGRLTGELFLGSKRPFGVFVGLSAGPLAELDPVAPPKFGAQATLWTFLGAIPFVRVGTVEPRGTFAEVGLRIVVPALRW